MKKSHLFSLACACAFITAFNSAEGANKTRDQIKESIDSFSESLKKGVDQFGDNLAAIQDYLEHYHWKGIIQDHATSGAESISHLKLNGRSRAIAVRPGEKIHCEMDCKLHSKEAAALSLYRVVVGFKGLGPQTTVGTSLGMASGKSHEKFHLTAPCQPGFYQVRFRTADQYLESNAFEAWYDKNGNEPDGTTTIGIVYVKG